MSAIANVSAATTVPVSPLHAPSGHKTAPAVSESTPPMGQESLQELRALAAEGDLLAIQRLATLMATQGALPLEKSRPQNLGVSLQA